MESSALPLYINEKTPLQHKNSLSAVFYSPLDTIEIDQDVPSSADRSLMKSRTLSGLVFMMGCFMLTILSIIFVRGWEKIPIMQAAWSSVAPPFSNVSPSKIGIKVLERPYGSKPGPIFSGISQSIPLPTNSWYENFFLGGEGNILQENNVFQVPYILDTSGFIQGVRTHPCHVQANDRTVMMNYDPLNGISLGAKERFTPQHYIRSQGTPAVSKLGVELEWLSPQDRVNDTSATHVYKGPSMRSPIVRGTPYTSMIYLDATPRVFAQRSLVGRIVVDNTAEKTMVCGTGFGNFSARPVTVEREIKFHLDTADMTWLVFVSEPTQFVCSTQVASSNWNADLYPPGVVPPPTDPSKGAVFELRAVRPMHRGMVRVAMSNNCTTGQNPEYCGLGHQPRDQSEYEQLLRFHAEVYPTAKSDIQFTFPVKSQEEEELRLIFNWKPAFMSQVANDTASEVYTYLESAGGGSDDTFGVPDVELLMMALPHQQERVRPIVGSSNEVLDIGCGPTIHGHTCPILGRTWSLVEHLHRVNFSAPRPMRDDMVPLVKTALKADLNFSLPPNYMAGAGDTYFSGKMLAKLGRILVIAEELGDVDRVAFDGALTRLRQGVEIWLNGSAQSPFLYDASWGGIVMCGCDYIYENGVGSCANKFPNCPALTDAGQNFGAGFYNDHHYHYGYHIYAAAVVAKFDRHWGKRFHEHVLMLVRDIANPSDGDEFFPTWRHKDWYLGFSWASGVVTIQGKPYPNGRNQESSSEAISAYEAVALYGGVMADIYEQDADQLLSSTPNGQVTDAVVLARQRRESSLQVRDMGRLLAATEIRSAITYWHVQDRSTPGVARIYPDVYAPKVVGMMWSMLAQEQTWFGNEPWKSYGIQLMPITPVSEQRDTVGWVAEMLPLFSASCATTSVCEEQGWSILVATCLATVGQWDLATQQVLALNESAFLSAGGNGHSLTNTLWYIATRPPMNVTSHIGN